MRLLLGRGGVKIGGKVYLLSSLKILKSEAKTGTRSKQKDESKRGEMWSEMHSALDYSEQAPQEHTTAHGVLTLSAREIAPRGKQVYRPRRDGLLI